MALLPGPLLYINRRFYPLSMHRHGNIATVDDDGVLLHMGENSDPFTERSPIQIPVVPPSGMAQGPHFSGGLQLRVPYSAIVDVWLDKAAEPKVNLWLRHAVVMAYGWTLVPLLWPPEMTARPEAR